MFLFPAKRPFDLLDYGPENNDPITFYGLPKEVEFCKKCVISNQRPNSTAEFKNNPSSKKETIRFDSGGVCDACNLAEIKKQKIDWFERSRELKDLCDRFRKRDGSYDCIVPGSGGKDSFYAAHVLKYEFDMHPLTVTWAPSIYTDWGWQNFQRWIHAGFDNFLCTPNGRVHRLLTRLAIENLFHPFQPFILGQKSLAPKMAIMHDVQLVFYGENEAEYGNPLADSLCAERNKSFYSAFRSDEIYLGGMSVYELKEHFGIQDVDLKPYMPADPDQLFDSKVEVRYLGYYLKWHPQSCYYYAVENGGFQASPERTPGTYSKYNSIDDRMDDFHYYTTFIKFGIGRATYDASQEIRSGDITRDEGIALVKRFDGEFPSRFACEIYRYLSLPPKQYPTASEIFEKPLIDHEYFMMLADVHRSPHIWKLENNEWHLRHAVWSSEGKT